MKNIFKELEFLFDNLNKNSIDDLVQLLLMSKEKSIIGIGAGRMGYSLRSFIMRLNHLTFKSYMIGDTNLPMIKKDDVVLFNSSSGETKSNILYAEIAKNHGAKIVVFSHSEFSSLALMANLKIIYPQISSKQIMKTIYEQFTLLLFDFISSKLVDSIDPDHSFISKNHSVLE
jgi:6-phospho-3-hexuloisomerase